MFSLLPFMFKFTVVKICPSYLVL